MGPEGQRMKQTGECFSCAFWELRAEVGCPTVIDNYVFTPGPRDKPWTDGGQGHGMSGRKFVIEYFDGRIITTYDLWGGGEIPERYRKRIPNTAKFLGGASIEKVGETTCFNPSK